MKLVSKILSFDKWLGAHISDADTDGWGLPIYEETLDETIKKSDKDMCWTGNDWIKYFLLILTILFICLIISYVCGWQCLSVHIPTLPSGKFF